MYIPKIYDGRNKTFLFFGQGLYYARLGGAGGLQTVPRADFKGGDFSNFVDDAGAQIPIFDPQPRGRTGVAASFVRSSRITSSQPSRISPVSAKIVALLPNPDLPTAKPTTGTTAPALSLTSTPLRRLRNSTTVSPRNKRLSVTYSNQWRPRLINSKGWGILRNARYPAFPTSRTFWRDSNCRR